MNYRVRLGSPTDAPVLMHIEHACRLASTFLPDETRHAKPRLWRAWLQCTPPFNRNPTERRIHVAYQNSEILGFIAAAHDSLFGGYDAHLHALYVLPRYRRQRIAFALLHFTAMWLDREGLTRLTADAYAHDPSHEFFHRMGGFIIAGADPHPEPAALLTYGFPSVRALALNIE